MKIDIITIFPEVCNPFLDESIMKRARQTKKIKVDVHDLRKYTNDKHKKVDDRPFGGGPGMLLMAQPIFDAVRKIRGRKKAKVILMCPKGKLLTQKVAKKLSKEKHLIILSAHYEGIDDRVRTEIVDENISIGDYILTGGDLPTLVLVDCLARLIPGVLGASESLHDESFEHNLLEYPQFTRPANFRGIRVPNVLLSGNHNQIKKWRFEQARKITKKNRPELLKEEK